jgi:2-keto-4-pentenoate hydratase/2-oxohepta-3-ene-1,7-dioic acid hydratase in catechol pathway
VVTGKHTKYISKADALSHVAGCIISTGTPPGVGLRQKPPHFLKLGDVVELGIDGYGTPKQTLAQG